MRSAALAIVGCGGSNNVGGASDMGLSWNTISPHLQLGLACARPRSRSAFTVHEFGDHVWQTGSPSQDIWLQFHDLKLHDNKLP